jgi:integrase
MQADKVKVSKKKKPVEIFSKEEFSYRLSVIKEKYPHLYGPAILAGFFGLRNGEICAINIEDFDFERNVLTVSKQYGYMGESIRHFDETKTEDGIRVVPIISYALPYIKENIEYIKRIAYEGKIHLVSGDNKLPFCLTKNGRRYVNSKLAERWKEMNEAEDWKHLTMHKLRHTFATLCRDAQVPMETISDLLGHADTKITKAIYAHKTFTQLEHASKSLDYLFKNNA